MRMSGGPRASQGVVVEPELTKIGARVSTKQDGRLLNATMMYFGTIKNKPGEWAGLDLDDECGKNNGSVGEDRYFYCPLKHGLFVHPSALLELDEVIAPYSFSFPILPCPGPADFIREIRSSSGQPCSFIHII